MLFSVIDLEGSALTDPQFQLGDLVFHKNHGYRGVIVASDPNCLAGDTWYYSNKTQPAKTQPWYHILVHDSGGLSTYVAESNLKQDLTRAPINHPRIGCYFEAFKEGRYTLSANQQKH